VNRFSVNWLGFLLRTGHFLGQLGLSPALVSIMGVIYFPANSSQMLKMLTPIFLNFALFPQEKSK
jgi:hypothetical protein